MFHVITARREENIVIKNLQEKSIFNKIRHIQAIGRKLISFPTKCPTPYHIGDIVKMTLKYDWQDSIFQMMRKDQNPPHSVNHFCVLRYYQTQKYSFQGYLLG